MRLLDLMVFFFFFVFFFLNEKYTIGKEIILRRYLNEQSEHPDLSGSLNHHPGFLNVAINHLKNNQRPRNHRKRQKLTTASLDG